MVYGTIYPNIIYFFAMSFYVSILFNVITVLFQTISNMAIEVRMKKKF